MIFGVINDRGLVQLELFIFGVLILRPLKRFVPKEN